MEGFDRKAIQILTAADQRFHADMTEPLKCGMARAFLAEEGAVLIRIADTWLWMLEDPGRADRIARIILDNGKPGDAIYSHGPVDKDAVGKLIGAGWFGKPCFVGARFSTVPLEIQTDLEFRRLDYSFSDFIIKHYNQSDYFTDTRAYIKDRLDAGMYGGFLNGECVGFIGIHEEGAMGMLEVLKPFRRRGYGRALESYLSNILIAEGKIPFCHIVFDNAASLELQRSMGFWISERKVWWGNILPEIFD